jgi:glyoxylase-like metal-dependent hydrolase (beta-lactamase superfamily II)/ferredoxin
VADPNRRLPANVDGDFFVDETCIDCGACRWMAPKTYDAADGAAYVQRQPDGERERWEALQALVACPTGSIGTLDRHDMTPILRSFPNPVGEDVYHCGFHDDASFGAASYLIVRPRGNVMVDVPRFNRGLIARIEALGGVDQLFLTHRDDVARHDRFAAHFGCRRIMHRRDRSTRTADVERWIEGDDPVALADDLLVIPTPGHTRGSACLIFDERVLFSGDHVAFHLREQRVYAFRGACWYDWDEQIRSMERLAGHRFEQILPGHGAPCRFPADVMHEQMERCVAWMRRAA